MIHYTGITRDLQQRLLEHNQGTRPHTSQYRSRRIETAIAFKSKTKARAFEKYLKRVRAGICSPPFLIFGRSAAESRALQFIPQSLLMPVRLHAFATLVLGNFCFPSFFKRAHSDFSNCGSIESSNSPQCKWSRGFGYLFSCDGSAAAFFLSCVPMPICFKNGSIDCLRPRNFSIDSLTSRESPGS
jgi:GIY-YIG catalytic domain